MIIEHNLEVIKTADWLIDIGPEAGGEGGSIVAAGPPEAIAKAKDSLTGAILKGVLAAGPFEERPRFDPKAAAKKMHRRGQGRQGAGRPRGPGPLGEGRPSLAHSSTESAGPASPPAGTA